MTTADRERRRRLAAERKRRQRARIRTGTAIAPVPYHDVETPHGLIEAGYLNPADQDDPAAIGAAIGHYLSATLGRSHA